MAILMSAITYPLNVKFTNELYDNTFHLQCTGPIAVECCLLGP